VVLLARKLGQQDGQAEPLLRAAQHRHPEDFWLNYALGDALRERKPAEAVGFYRAALVTRPTVATVHFEVSLALLRQGQVDEATRAARRVVELIPMLPVSHHQLGMCLQASGQLDEAMVEYRRAIEIDPKGSDAHYELGFCLVGRGQLDQAMVELRRAIQLQPKAAYAHDMLGICLKDMGHLDEAMAECRLAIQLDPKLAHAHHSLGMCLQATARLDEAMAEYRRAIEIDPKGSDAYHNLGMCLEAGGRLDEAMAEFRRAVELDPRGGLWQEALAEGLLRSGRFGEARTAIEHGLDVLPAKVPARAALREKLLLCERLLALDARLPALLQQKEQPAAAELRELARLCQDYGRPHAAVDLYARAFAARPALADGDHYNAACAAARAGVGEGVVGVPLSDLKLVRLRRRALDWLRADLEQQTKLFEGGKSVEGAMSFWQKDTDLLGVRDPAALAKLADDERASWQRFWADVAKLRAADPLGQGRTHAARRQWAPAVEGYARALKRGPTDDGHFWFEYAACCCCPAIARATPGRVPT
jgi:tetratricopeptide (TPR) repeat protein